MTTSLRVAVQMDPIETINIDGDSTFALMLEAAREQGTAFVLVTHDQDLAARCEQRWLLKGGHLQ